MDSAAPSRQRCPMAGISGYRVAIPGGVTIGRVAGETDAGYLISVGNVLRRSYRVVPHRHGWVEEGRRTLLLAVSERRLRDAPACGRDGRVDPAALERYWADARA